MIIIAIVLGVCLLIGAGIWFFCDRKSKTAANAQAALEAETAMKADLVRLKTEDLVFVAMSYDDTPNRAAYGTEDIELIKEAAGWIENAGFHSTAVHLSEDDRLARPAGFGSDYTFTLHDGSEIHFCTSENNGIEYNGWIYRVDDTELEVKFRALYDSVKDKAQTHPSHSNSAA